MSEELQAVDLKLSHRTEIIFSTTYRISPASCPIVGEGKRLFETNSLSTSSGSPLSVSTDLKIIPMESSLSWHSLEMVVR